MNSPASLVDTVEVGLDFDTSPNPLFIADADGRIIYANAATVRRYGYSMAELLGMPAIALAGISMRAHHRQNLRKTLTEPCHFEWVHRRKDGSEFPVETNTRPVVFRGVPGVLASVRDLTREKEQAQQMALQAAILANMVEGICLVSVDTHRIVFSNAYFESMLGYGSGELIGRDIAIINAPNDRTAEEVATDILVSLRVDRQWRGNVKNRRKDGSEIWTRAIITEFEHFQYGPVWLNVQRDITAVVQTRIERDQALEDLRRLSFSVQENIENERMEIAHDIHDHLGSALTGMRLQLEAAASSEDADAAQLRQRLRDLARLAAQALDQTRSICSRLRPQMLEDLGLVETLRWYVWDWSVQTGIVATVRLPRLDSLANGQLATTTFRITQELLTNVARHSAARHVRVNLTVAKDGLRLCVADDGRGFDVSARVTGFGLMGVRERARRHEGHLFIESGNGGTKAIVRGLREVVS